MDVLVNNAGIVRSAPLAQVSDEGYQLQVAINLTGDIPLGCLSEPDDIAGVVSFLASADSGWVNGQVIKANGGKGARSASW